jgi:hypothetical protein
MTQPPHVSSLTVGALSALYNALTYDFRALESFGFILDTTMRVNHDSHRLLADAIVASDTAIALLDDLTAEHVAQSLRATAELANLVADRLTPNQETPTC